MQGATSDAMGQRCICSSGIQQRDSLSSSSPSQHHLVDALSSFQMPPLTTEMLKSSFERLWELMGDALVPVIVASCRNHPTNHHQSEIGIALDTECHCDRSLYTDDWALLIL